MNKTDIQKGKMVYYARMLKPVGIYEVCDLYVRTVRDDYFVGTDKRDKHAYLFSYNKLDIDTVLEAEKNAPKISDEQEYEEY